MSGITTVGVSAMAIGMYQIICALFGLVPNLIAGIVLMVIGIAVAVIFEVVKE